MGLNIVHLQRNVTLRKILVCLQKRKMFHAALGLGKFVLY